MKKNDVAKMRQEGTAPATGMTIYCLTSLWCSVIHASKHCSAMWTTNTDHATSEPPLHTKTATVRLMCKFLLHYAKSYRPFELFVNENYKLRNDLKLI